MLFSGIPFLYYFLPAVLITYFLAPWKLKNTVLLLSSLIFYGWGEPKLLFLMLFTIVLFYGCGLAISRAGEQKMKKIWLLVSVVISVALLGLFKYADFFIGSFNSLTGLGIPMLRLALPVGISFYTFQCLSYTIDVYWGNVPPQKNLLSFGAYVTMFPQLIAGPIVRYLDIERQLNGRTHSVEKFFQGMRRFLIGLGKKVILADNFALLCKIFRESDEKSVLFYWLYAVAFLMNIYFDFSGYSDMGIGMGRIFGFHFPENFNYPYLSRSITEFWRRWHMTLGTWFRDYVYIPMGGNRVSKGRWVFNILTVWMLTGLWHGADWHFVLWGLFFGVFLMIEKWVPALQKLPSFLRHLYVLIAILFSFVLFNADNISMAFHDFGGMLGLMDLPLVSAPALYYLRSYGVLFLVGIIGSTPVVKQTAIRLGRTKAAAILEPVLLAALLLVCTAYLVDGSFSPFLYFRF